MNMKNIMGQLLNQLVGNKANSSGEGWAHNNYGPALPPTHLEQAQLIVMWKRASSSGK